MHPLMDAVGAIDRVSPVCFNRAATVPKSPAHAAVYKPSQRANAGWVSRFGIRSIGEFVDECQRIRLSIFKLCRQLDASDHLIPIKVLRLQK